jgi:acyl carrier protein
MTRDEAIQKVYEVLHEMLPELDSISEDIDMLDDLGLLDLDLIEVQLMLEEKFSIQLEDSDTDAIGEGNYRVGDWVDRIMTIRTQQEQQTKETK